MSTQLDPSELGTKEYWDALYHRELRNHAADGRDQGTVWFDESNAEDTVRRELEALAAEGLLDKAAASFLDLGTGNGHMLFALRFPTASSDDDDDDDEGGHDDDDDDDVDDVDDVEAQPSAWRGSMIGVDYSAPSIDLARRISSAYTAPLDGDGDGGDGGGGGAKTDGPRFETWDLLTQSPSACPGGGLPPAGSDVVLDKGTFDAISLMAPSTATATSTQHPCALYRARVTPLIKRDAGFLVLTSCNWTRDELLAWLVGDGDGDAGDGGLELFREARYPSFTFGGRTGQSVVTLIFRRRGARRGQGGG